MGLNRNTFIKFLSFCLIIHSISCKTCPQKDKAINELYMGMEFKMSVVEEPFFPDNFVNITDFGAVGNGQVLNTEAFAKAIDQLASEGGGKLIIPKGIWLTGPIVLKNNINLHAEAGSLVVFSKNKNHYHLINTSYEGLDAVRCMSPIYGKGLENIAITGNGVFDGAGEVWRSVQKYKLTDLQWQNFLKAGGIVGDSGKVWYPSESYLKGQQANKLDNLRQYKTIENFQEVKDFLRPVMLSLVNCKNILLDGPTFQNSPAWCLHPLMCENLIVRNITVKNPWYASNGDGLDIESCKNTVVYNCNFDVGDDAICIKSGKDENGRRRGIATENLLIKNCIVYHGHGGFVIGSEMSGGVKNVHVSNCTFIGTDKGLRFKSRRGRGGVVENIYISDIAMTNIEQNAISFNLYYFDQPNQTGEVPQPSKETPLFKNISIKRIICRGAGTAIYLQGLPEMNIRNISLSGIDIEAEHGLICNEVEQLVIDGFRLVTEKMPAITVENSCNVTIKGYDYPVFNDTLILIRGNKSSKIRIDGVKSIKTNAVIIESILKNEITIN